MSNTKTIYCRMQNRLGAFDRVVGAFTHRGIIPARLTATHDETNGVIETVVVFDCADTKVLDKLVKFLQKQVYIIETKSFSYDLASETETPEGISVGLPLMKPNSGSDASSFMSSSSAMAAVRAAAKTRVRA